MIRDVTPADAPAICDIYNHYTLTTVITFDEAPITVEQMQQRIADVTSRYPWLVSVEDDRLLGYAYVGQWRKQPAYRSMAECTIYLHPDTVGRGLGKPLFAALLDRVRQTSLHTLVSGIAIPNDPSVRLHEAFGFEKVAHFKQAGFKLGRWVDVGYWQLVLPDEPAAEKPEACSP